MTVDRIARDVLPDGKVVSTVYIGFGPTLEGGNFETMVFSSEEDFADMDCRRYESKDEAIAGHREMVKKWSEQ